MAQTSRNAEKDELKESFQEILLKSCTLEFMQIKGFRPDERTQKKELVVVRTCANRLNEADKTNKGAGAANENHQGPQGE